MNRYAVLSVLAAATAVGSLAAVPNTLGFQGYLTDSTGRAVADGLHPVQFRLFELADGGIAFWTSGVQNVATTRGAFRTEIGPLEPSALAEKSEVWVEVSAGDPQETLSPRVRLATAPFAFRAADLEMPFTGTSTSAAQTLLVGNTGTGKAAYFNVNSPDNASSALAAATNGTGSAVHAASIGTGRAGFFQVENGGSLSPALEGLTNGRGPAIKGYTTGATAGYFEVNSGGIAATFSNALMVTTNNRGDALRAETSGDGDAVSGITTGAPLSNAGSFVVDNVFNTSSAVWASTNGTGAAVNGHTVGTGSAGVFRVDNAADSSPALLATTNGTGQAVRADATGGSTAVYAVTAGGAGNAVYGLTTGTGTAGVFTINNPASGSHALVASTNGNGNGMYSTASGSGYGIYGRSTGAGDGIRGFTTGTGSAVSAGTTGTGSAGRFEVSNSDSASPAVEAESNGTGFVGRFENTNAGNPNSTLYVETNGSGRAVRGYVTGSAWAGYFTAAGGSAGKGVYISVPAGNTGLNVASGTKNAVVATSTGARLLYTEESAEVWFTDYGFGQLNRGRAVIDIEPVFAGTVDLAQPYHVFLQPNDATCVGMAVVNRGVHSFEVRELQAGKSNAEFSYRIVAKRKHYERTRLERAPYADDDPNLYPGAAPNITEGRG